MKSMIKVTDRNMIQSFRYCVRKKENGLIVFDKYKIKKKNKCHVTALLSLIVFLILMVLCYLKNILIILCYPAYYMNWSVLKI